MPITINTTIALIFAVILISLFTSIITQCLTTHLLLQRNHCLPAIFKPDAAFILNQRNSTGKTEHFDKNTITNNNETFKLADSAATDNSATGKGIDINNVNVTGNIKLNKDLDVNGNNINNCGKLQCKNIEANGTITFNNDVVADIVNANSSVFVTNDNGNFDYISTKTAKSNGNVNVNENAKLISKDLATKKLILNGDVENMTFSDKFEKVLDNFMVHYIGYV